MRRRKDFFSAPPHANMMMLKSMEGIDGSSLVCMDVEVIKSALTSKKDH